ncbi:MAG: hypothetical protein ACE5HP_10385 [Gemmatimonadota bacterium]
MMLGYKKLGGMILGAAALLALVPAAASAQFVRYSPIFWSFDVRGGGAIPVGDLKDVADAGPTVGAGLAYFLNPRFALRLDGNVDFLQAGDPGPDAVSDTPDLTVIRYTGGFEVHLTNPNTSRAMATLGLSLGAATFNSQTFGVTNFNGVTKRPEPGATTIESLEDTYFLLAVPFRLGVHASRIVDLFLGGRIDVAFADEDDTAAFAAFFGEQPFDTTVLIPIEGGIRINIP